MKAWWNWVATSLNREEEGFSLALFRIACGATIFGELFLTWWTGAAWLFYQDIEGGGYRPKMTSAHWLYGVIGPPDNAVMGMVFTVCMVTSVLVAVGLGTNLAALVLLFFIQALFTVSGGAGGGHDRMMTIALFVLVLSRSDATMSVWSRLRYGAWLSGEKVRAWSRSVMES